MFTCMRHSPAKPFICIASVTGQFTSALSHERYPPPLHPRPITTSRCHSRVMPRICQCPHSRCRSRVTPHSRVTPYSRVTLPLTSHAVTHESRPPLTSHAPLLLMPPLTSHSPTSPNTPTHESFTHFSQCPLSRVIHPLLPMPPLTSHAPTSLNAPTHESRCHS